MKKNNKYMGGLGAILILSIMTTGFRKENISLSDNKKTVTDYMNGFNAGDHKKILSCLTEDIIWEMPGVYHHSGKAAFDKEIENDAFVGKPVINVIRWLKNGRWSSPKVLYKEKEKTAGYLTLFFAMCVIWKKERLKSSPVI